MSLICIFAYVCVSFRTSHWLYLFTHRLHAAAALARLCDTYRAYSPVLFTGQWLEVKWPPLCFKLGRGFATLSRQTLLNEDRKCCESWRYAELWDRAVCAVGGTTCKERWVNVRCFSSHCDTAESCLTDDTLTTSSTNCYDDWRQAITDRSPPVLRRQQSVSSLSSTCHNASAALRLLLAASSVCWVTFSVSYYVIDYLSPFTC